MMSPKDRPPKKIVRKKRPLRELTPTEKRWVDYGITEAEEWANGVPKDDKLPN